MAFNLPTSSRIPRHWDKDEALVRWWWGQTVAGLRRGTCVARVPGIAGSTADTRGRILTTYVVPPGVALRWHSKGLDQGNVVRATHHAVAASVRCGTSGR